MKYSSNDIRALTSVQAAVLIPLMQGAITGVFVGILCGTVAMLTGAPFWKWALVSGAASGLLAW
ncbi:MAG: hypothetical protein WC657_07430, partial [Candidatus Paceibacterota bacterium]